MRLPLHAIERLPGHGPAPADADGRKRRATAFAAARQ